MQRYIVLSKKQLAQPLTVQLLRHSRRRDGRSAWKALVSSHAGNDKWEQLQKENSRWIMNTKWNGRVYTLEKFCNWHRKKFVNLEEARNHVDFQLPTNHTRVGYLLDNIENPDADLRAALANIRQNVNDTRNNFENAVSVLLPVDPYVKQRRKNNKKGDEGGANISFTKGQPTTGSGKGKTGVNLRFHKPDEYKTLTSDQKDELRLWRLTSVGKKQTDDEMKKRKGSPRKASIQSAVKDALEQERKKQKQDSDQYNEMAAIIAGVTQKSASSTPVTNAHMEAVQKLMAIKNRASSSE